MTDKVICNEEAIRKLYAENPDKSDFLRAMMDMQQENIKTFAGPFIKYVESMIDAAPEPMKDKMGNLMSITAGTIAGNILLNTPGFNKKRFLSQLDEMIELMEKDNG